MSTIRKRLEAFERAAAALAGAEEQAAESGAETLRIIEAAYPDEDEREAFCAMYARALGKIRDGLPLEASDYGDRKATRIILTLAEAALARMDTAKSPVHA